MDFVAVMLFAQQVFHLECLFIYFYSFWYLRLLLFWIKPQPGVAYKCCLWKRKCWGVRKKYKKGVVYRRWSLNLLHTILYVCIGNSEIFLAKYSLFLRIPHHICFIPHPVSFSCLHELDSFLWMTSKYFCL